MGAVCYKPKRTRITKEEVLRALNTKHLKHTITEPDSKTLKTEDQNQLVTFSQFSQHMNIDTELTSMNQRYNFKQKQHQLLTSKQNSLISNLKDVELKILSYYSNKDQVYETLSQLSRNSLIFLRKNFPRIERDKNFRHANEKIQFVQTKSLEEHSSGVNQMVRLSSKELITVSDDCTLKIWSAHSLKIEAQISTETITCICATGNPKKDILVAGCHSGNLIIVNGTQRIKKETITNAHYNLIRVIVSLENLKNKYFVTADVCGIIKVWTASYKPVQTNEIQLNSAISYNSMIEMIETLPKKLNQGGKGSLEETSLIAVALKSNKVNILLLIPNSGEHQQIMTLHTFKKPTCLIQLTPRLVAIATGSLKEASQIEVQDVYQDRTLSILKNHTDMIDSMLKVTFPEEKMKSTNKYVMWLLSAGRDRCITLWKLLDGKLMKRCVVNSGKGRLHSSNSALSLVHNPNSYPVTLTVQNQRRQKGHGSSRQSQRNKKKREDESSQSVDEDAIPIASNPDEETKKELDEVRMEATLPQQDREFYFSLETSHKDFIRSMVQLNDTTLLTASEDKTIKIFTIAF